ncbi:MAG: response regulator [Deltaproteobacteria bacterium]|nr:response regulator [Deltaproteobacteria bacterium]
MKILIVDDSRAMRSIVRRAMRQAGYGENEFEEAGNGKEAMEVIGSFSPELVLCDWNMPEMNGLEVLEALRGQGSGIPFGFVTSEGTDEMKQTAKDAGATFFITKPFNADTLQAALEGHIN